MSMPGFQEMMYPILEIFSEKNQDLRIGDLLNDIAKKFNLTEEETRETIPSGTETILKNRVSWAVYYMYRAGFLSKEKRGFYKISDLGLKEYKKETKLSIKVLKQFDQFKEFLNKTQNPSNELLSEEIDMDPETKLENAMQIITRDVKLNILEELRAMNAYAFEGFIKNFIEKLGYGEGHVTQKSNDEGIDVIVNEDELGLSKIYLQVKRYTEGNNVGRVDLQSFAGAMDAFSTTQGIFITTSTFTKNGIDYIDKIRPTGKSIILIDGSKLADLMIKHKIGVKLKKGYEIVEIDQSYFVE